MRTHLWKLVEVDYNNFGEGEEYRCDRCGCYGGSLYGDPQRTVWIDHRRVELPDDCDRSREIIIEQCQGLDLVEPVFTTENLYDRSYYARHNVDGQWGRTVGLDAEPSDVRLRRKVLELVDKVLDWMFS